jgi:hypothetical protein
MLSYHMVARVLATGEVRALATGGRENAEIQCYVMLCYSRLTIHVS